MNKTTNRPGIIQVGNVLCSIDIFEQMFCCNLRACRGACCVEGDAGAPVTEEEIGELEDALDIIESELTPQARNVIQKQGVAYIDNQGDLVTSIVDGRDCVFAVEAAVNSASSDSRHAQHSNNQPITICAIERAQREGRLTTLKPLSCALYPIRMKKFNMPNGETLYGLNYHRWNICRDAEDKGFRLSLPVYRFLKEPLIRAFGEQWYKELEAVAAQL